VSDKREKEGRGRGLCLCRKWSGGEVRRGKNKAELEYEKREKCVVPVSKESEKKKLNNRGGGNHQK
jgi:hypothetical protein